MQLSLLSLPLPCKQANKRILMGMHDHQVASS